MDRNNVLDDFSKSPVVLNIMPGHSPENICRLIEVMKEQGYRVLEILGRPIGDALELLRALDSAPHRGLVRVGIGTIKTESDAKLAVKVKPDFIVSPAFSRRVLNVAVEADIPYVPGVCTLQDVQDVVDAFGDVGREVAVLKLCPVEILTRDYVRMMGSIYPGITFCPTGTVTLETLPEWKRIPCVGPAMESSFVPPEMLDREDWNAVRARLREIRSTGQI